MRADQLLVHRGLAPSRSAAQRLIAQGAVRWHGPRGWRAPRKAGDDLPEGCELQILDDAEIRWVSRGGLKLAGALAHIGLVVVGGSALDVGQSTGGFTEVLLEAGASHVTGIDVGHGQLHPSLASDPRVQAFEGLHARDLPTANLPHAQYDLVVADLSFISLTLVLPAFAPRARRDLLLLVKPQFELQPADIGKGGLVTDPVLHQRVRERVTSSAANAGLQVRDWFPSAVKGGDGNTEFFLWAQT